MNMEDKTPTGQTSYQGRGSNLERRFSRGCGDFYGRDWGCEFNPTKPKVRGKFEALGSDMYSIGDSWQVKKHKQNRCNTKLHPRQFQWS